MNICSEHGDDIAFVGKYCPACAEIEKLEEEHQQALEKADSHE